MRVLFAVLGALQAVVVFVVALPLWILVAVIAGIALWRARRAAGPDEPHNTDDESPRRRDLGVAA